MAEKSESKKMLYIFTPYRIKKDETRVYVSQYGKKAFRILKENR